MGLDGAELVLAIEDSFQIQLPDERIGRVATVGIYTIWCLRS
jgi:acyl carrier protein